MSHYILGTDNDDDDYDPNNDPNVTGVAADPTSPSHGGSTSKDGAGTSKTPPSQPGRSKNTAAPTGQKAATTKKGNKALFSLVRKSANFKFITGGI